MIVVIMGVSGCGKTEVGSQLANKLCWKFYDADDYHPHSNKLKMGKGIPLNDQDRHPWLCDLHNLILSDKACGQHVVLACSALKKAYREMLATGAQSCTSDRQQQEIQDPDLFFIHLQGSWKVISERFQKRTGHFMPVELLASQFDTLEPPAAPEHFMTVNVEKDVSQIVSEIQSVLEDKMQGPVRAEVD
ncbi:PREDICTED: probable gluconokinase [Nanorana parkeri]|uniref:probable gluconokinase n=1 Tax=Nanorana parkeri TaxID=125878 RepID=UPI0008546D99|nr:PREDICTED: probable gluconokinase [Nanorana parkeri]